MKHAAILACLITLSSCRTSESKAPDLLDEADKLVSSVSLQADSTVTHVQKTSIQSAAPPATSINGLHSVAIGDNVDGVQIGAIKCVFFKKDVVYGGTQFEWRGRWGCQAGRNQDELEHILNSDGSKRYDYIFIAPITFELKRTVSPSVAGKIEYADMLYI